jgi:hypothetical protein
VDGYSMLAGCVVGLVCQQEKSKGEGINRFHAAPCSVSRWARRWGQPTQSQSSILAGYFDTRICNIIQLNRYIHKQR